MAEKGNNRMKLKSSSLREMVSFLLGAAVATLVCSYIQHDSKSQDLWSLERFAAQEQDLLHDAPRRTNLAGWHPIHVFYGKMNHLLDPIGEKRWIKDSPRHQGKKWFSQHGQDIAVAKVHQFKSSGYFVDLAANDAVWASNTFALEHNFNWNGICIEVNPFYWYRLSFRKCQVIGAIVGANDFEEVDVVLGSAQHDSPLGGIVGPEFDNKNARHPEKRYSTSLGTILKMFDAPKVIDYLSLDVEGAETFIMRNFAWDEYTFLSITIERPSEELQQKLASQGYRKLMDIRRGDTLWVHSSIYEQAKANIDINTDEIFNHEVAAFPPS